MFKKLTSEELRAHKGLSFPGISTSFIIYRNDGKIFLHMRSKNTRDEHGMWDFGGGGLKFGQTLDQNLRRELKEEFDIEPLKVDFIGYSDVFRETEDHQPTHWLAMYFAVKVDPDKVRVMESDMVDDSGWFVIGNFPKPQHSQMQKFFDQHSASLMAIINNV